MSKKAMIMTGCKLSVNVNKVATLRNARGGNRPNLLSVVSDIESFGANGITVHPRPDERHIRYQDVRELSQMVKTEFNIEGYPSQEWMDLVLSVCPAQATLVPDSPNALTSNAGWNTIDKGALLTERISELKEAGIRTSIFVDTAQVNIEGAKKCGADRIELYTEPYAYNYSLDPNAAVEPFRKAAKYAQEMELGINAGHDLNLENLAFFTKEVDHLAEVSIGHALICDALYFGLENTIQMYLQKIE